MLLKLILVIFICFGISCSQTIITSNSTQKANKLKINRKLLPNLVEIEAVKLLDRIYSTKDKKLIYVWWSANCGASFSNIAKLLNDTSIKSFNICCDYSTAAQRNLIQKFLYLEGIKTKSYILDNSIWRMLTFDMKNSSKTQDFIRNFSTEYIISNESGVTDIKNGCYNGYFIPYIAVLDNKNKIIYEKKGVIEIDSLKYFLELK